MRVLSEQGPALGNGRQDASRGTVGVRVYEDAGASGESLARDGLRHAIDAVEDGEADVLLVANDEGVPTPRGGRWHSPE